MAGAPAAAYGKLPQEAGGVSVAAMLEAIPSKLRTGRRPRPAASAVSDNVFVVTEDTGRIKWVQPSGVHPQLCYDTSSSAANRARVDYMRAMLSVKLSDADATDAVDSHCAVLKPNSITVTCQVGLRCRVRHAGPRRTNEGLAENEQGVIGGELSPNGCDGRPWQFYT